MGNIGNPRRRIEVLPEDEPAPAPQQVPVPAPPVPPAPAEPAHEPARR